MNRHLDKWNKVESPETSLSFYGQLIFNKHAKGFQWGKDTLFNKWCLTIWISNAKKRKKKEQL